MPRVVPSAGKDAARRLLNDAYNAKYKSSLDTVATTLGGCGPNMLHVHYTPSLLSSASLFANHVKHRLLRNSHNLTGPIIRKIEEVSSEKHPFWVHSSSQEARAMQIVHAKKQLRLREDNLLIRLKFRPDNAALTPELEGIREELRRLDLSTFHLSAHIKGNIHPTSLLSGDRAFLTPSEVAQLPSAMGAVRGILIRIKGPRRGNRAWTWQKTAGRYSTNSVDFVAAEEIKLPIPTKQGIYGLTVRIVHCKKDRLVLPSRTLKVIDRPDFAFFKGLGHSSFH